MRALIQRVKTASVTINNAETRTLPGPGLLILLGVTHSDTVETAELLAQKCALLRIFEDENGKMNLSLLDTWKQALVVSQFTLYADTRKGRRPAFTDAAPPSLAVPLYEHFLKSLAAQNVALQTGTFGADMQVSLINDGPVTIMLEV